MTDKPFRFDRAPTFQEVYGRVWKFSPVSPTLTKLWERKFIVVSKHEDSSRIWIRVDGVKCSHTKSGLWPMGLYEFSEDRGARVEEVPNNGA